MKVCYNLVQASLIIESYFSEAIDMDTLDEHGTFIFSDVLIMYHIVLKYFKVRI